MIRLALCVAALSLWCTATVLAAGEVLSQSETDIYYEYLTGVSKLKNEKLDSAAAMRKHEGIDEEVLNQVNRKHEQGGDAALNEDELKLYRKSRMIRDVVHQDYIQALAKFEESLAAKNKMNREQLNQLIEKGEGRKLSLQENVIFRDLHAAFPNLDIILAGSEYIDKLQKIADKHKVSFPVVLDIYYKGILERVESQFSH
jgi:hypothetical protein